MHTQQGSCIFSTSYNLPQKAANPGSSAYLTCIPAASAHMDRLKCRCEGARDNNQAHIQEHTTRLMGRTCDPEGTEDTQGYRALGTNHIVSTSQWTITMPKATQVNVTCWYAGVKGHETVTRTTRKRAAAQPAATDAAPPQRATRSRAGRPPRAPLPTLATVAEDEEEEPDEDQEAAGHNSSQIGQPISRTCYLAAVSGLLMSCGNQPPSSDCLGQVGPKQSDSACKVFKCQRSLAAVVHIKPKLDKFMDLQV